MLQCCESNTESNNRVEQTSRRSIRSELHVELGTSYILKRLPIGRILQSRQHIESHVLCATQHTNSNSSIMGEFIIETVLKGPVKTDMKLSSYC